MQVADTLSEAYAALVCEALLDVLYGRFNPTGKLPLTIPKDQVAVEKNASDVPGYDENFCYTYTNADGNKYVFGFGLSY